MRAVALHRLCYLRPAQSRLLNVKSSISTDNRLTSRAITSTSSYAAALPSGYEQKSRQLNYVLSPEDEKLVNRNEFHGVIAARANANIRVPVPETVLGIIQNSLGSKYRVTADFVLGGVVLPLENDDKQFVSVLSRSSERWVPMLIAACGSPMSNVDSSSRMQILNRLWTQLEKHKIPISIATFNRRLSVLLENYAEWNPEEALVECEQRRQLESTAETLHLLCEKCAREGDEERLEKMGYERARRGHPADASTLAALAYVLELRGKEDRVQQVIDSTVEKYGNEGHISVMAAVFRAAAARGDVDRLRKLMWQSMISDRRLMIPQEDVLESIFLLARNSHDGLGGSYVQLAEEMLASVQRKSGFFRHLFREIERHTAHQLFHTSVALLEDTKRLEDCIRNQDRPLYLSQLVNQLCRQMIRHEYPLRKIEDIANRVQAIYPKQLDGPNIYTDLLYNALMYKEFSSDKRLDYLAAFVEKVDADRSRMHLVLPLIVNETSLDGRLKMIFRSSLVGYTRFSQLDPIIFQNLILQPLYDRQLGLRRLDQPPLQNVCRILKSFGMKENEVWLSLHSWWKRKESEERRLPADQTVTPFAGQVNDWLRSSYEAIFATPETKRSPPVPGLDRLLTLIGNRDSSRVYQHLVHHGWPEGEVEWEKVVDEVVDLGILHEDWVTLNKVLQGLSAQSHRWRGVSGSEGDVEVSPVTNLHLLRLLRRYTYEKEMRVADLVEYAYELRRLFPFAVCSYDNFMDTMHEYSRLFRRCYDQPDLKIDDVNASIELLRTLVKLHVLELHPNEHLTTTIVGNVFKKFGWSEAVLTWMKLQSGLDSCNGLILLIREAHKKWDQLEEPLEYVLHKAESYMTESRVRAVHLAVLVEMKLEEQTAELIHKYSQHMDPMDGLYAMKLMLAFKFKHSDEEFILSFCRHMLTGWKLDGESPAATALLAEAIRVCLMRRESRLAVKVVELFDEKGIQMCTSDRAKLQNMLDRKKKLTDEWCFSPQGLLNLKKNDPIVKDIQQQNLQEKLALV